MAKGVRTFLLEVPNGELYHIVKGLDSKMVPHMADQGREIIRYSPDEVLEDVEDVRLVTRGTRGGLRTVHSFSPRADGRTEVMVEMEASLFRGGSTAVNLNMAMWTMTYMGIESAYRSGRSPSPPKA